MPLLFSYGTLQDEQVQLSTFGRRLDGQHDALVGYKPSLVRIDDQEVTGALGRTHHANMTFTGNDADRVPGTRFEITDAELAQADAFEAPFNYVRVAATLASGREAWVYAYEPASTIDNR
jgi:gamma-glutamylcyclotransferase (GGCT)/AIG2-like uncharacterized protein YtfP